MEIGKDVVVEFTGKLLGIKDILGSTYYMVMDDSTRECCLVKRNNIREA